MKWTSQALLTLALMTPASALACGMGAIGLPTGPLLAPGLTTQMRAEPAIGPGLRLLPRFPLGLEVTHGWTLDGVGAGQASVQLRWPHVPRPLSVYGSVGAGWRADADQVVGARVGGGLELGLRGGIGLNAEVTQRFAGEGLQPTGLFGMYIYH